VQRGSELGAAALTKAHCMVGYASCKPAGALVFILLIYYYIFYYAVKCNLTGLKM